MREVTSEITPVYLSAQYWNCPGLFLLCTQEQRLLDISNWEKKIDWSTVLYLFVMSLQSSVTSKQRKGYKTEDKGNKSENELGSYVSCSVTLKSWLCLSDNTEEHSILFQHLRSYNWVKQRNDISHWLLPSWYWYCPIKNDDISLIQRIFIFKIARLCKSKSYYQYVLSQDVLYIN